MEVVSHYQVQGVYMAVQIIIKIYYIGKYLYINIVNYEFSFRNPREDLNTFSGIIGERSTILNYLRTSRICVEGTVKTEVQQGCWAP